MKLRPPYQLVAKVNDERVLDERLFALKDEQYHLFDELDGNGLYFLDEKESGYYLHDYKLEDLDRVFAAVDIDGANIPMREVFQWDGGEFGD